MVFESVQILKGEVLMVFKVSKKAVAFILSIALILSFIPGVQSYAAADEKSYNPMSTEQGASSVSNFYNVIFQTGSDPWVYKHTDGYYYNVFTNASGIMIRRSKTITSLDSGERSLAWTPVKGTMYSSDIWAPEMHYLKDTDGKYKWYIYFAADDGTNANHRLYVLENDSENPMTGTWEFKGKITAPTERWAIDGTVLEVKGELYFIWSGWGETNGNFQNLYIAKMSNPWTISSERVLISTPDYDWETSSSAINEGPEVLVRGNTIDLVYSANASWTDNYCLGLITADMNADLLDPASWVKKDQPIFSSANGVYGPGHCSFVTSPDGSEDWIIYHSSRWQGAGWTRNVRAQKFTWNDDGTPNLGEPVDPNQPIATPSGEPVRQRYEAEAALLVKDSGVGTGPSVRWESTASGGKKITNIQNANDYAQFTVSVPETGFYMLSVRDANGASSGADASLIMSVNGSSGTNLGVVHSGWNLWGASTAKVYLKQGDNTIRFAAGTNLAEIDSMDIFRLDSSEILFDAPGYTLGLGDSFSLPMYALTGTACSPVDSGVSFRSSNTEVAAIDGTVVKGLKSGSATITATYNGKTATAAVTVTTEPKSVQSIAIGGINNILTSGLTGQLRLTASYNTHAVQNVTADATYFSSNPDVAEVTATGQVYAAGPGNTVIKASYGGKEAQFNLTVTPDSSQTPQILSQVKTPSGVIPRLPSVVDVNYKGESGTAEVSWNLEGINFNSLGTVQVPVVLTLNGEKIPAAACVEVIPGWGLDEIVNEVRSRIDNFSYPLGEGLGNYSRSAYDALLTELNYAEEISADASLTEEQFNREQSVLAEAEATLLGSLNLTEDGVTYNAYRDFSGDETGKYPFGITTKDLTNGATATVQEEDGNKFLRMTTTATAGKANLFLPYAGEVTATGDQRIVIEYRTRLNTNFQYANGAMVRNDSGTGNYSMVTAFDMGKFVVQNGGIKNKIQDIMYNTWYKIKMVANWDAKTYTVYLNDDPVPVATDYTFRHTGGSMLTGQLFGIDGYANASIDFDDFKVMVTGQEKTAPVISAALSPEVPDGQNGWYTHPVTLSLSAEGQQTGDSEIVYSLDDGTTWQTYTAPVTFSQDGTYTVIYRSADTAADEENVKSVSFKLDMQAPTIETAIPEGGKLDEDSLDLNSLITTSDATSGVDDSKTTVTLDENFYEIGTTIPLPLGTHTLVVSAVDLAGNTSSKTVVFDTVTSINSLKALVTRFAKSKEINNAGVANSMQAKLKNGNLNGFVNEVQAQNGKHISSDAANDLLENARFLLSQQP